MRGQFLPATKDGLGFLDLKKMKTYTAMISWTIHGKKNIGHAKKTIRGIKCETIQEAIENALQSGPKNHTVCLNCIWPDYLKK